ncbi:hypothetical protein [Moorena sp. SIO2C4]|uniref:hypothetical protein n=1 Tax=Moorena sp. SIO2C4 TaxID=2607824 RepID=UPI0013C29827|nr:hypothetical protein [Moorena sp. SIO2C4]NEQ17811.1 hypothetical protein [Moorena sp. SIO3E2]NES40331.1 hypothetical protein [Moorena sp. SIO2C4]
MTVRFSSTALSLIGRPSEIVDEELLKRILEVFPLLFPLLGIDDKAKFCEMLVHRNSICCVHGYPQHYLHLYDIVMLADILRCYISDVVANVISIKLTK